MQDGAKRITLGAIMRAQLALLMTAVVVAGASAVRAYYKADSSLLAFGERVTSIIPTKLGAITKVRVNGEEVYLTAAVVGHDVQTVTEAFEAHCADESGNVAADLAPLLKGGLPRGLEERLAAPERFTTMTQQDGADGAEVACLVRPKQGPSLLDRVERLAQTGDLGALGGLRYLRAKRLVESGLTQVIMVWSDARFNLTEMFPGDRDAPGEDPSTAPRPPHAVRTFSARVISGQEAAYTFEAKGRAQDIIAHYEAALPARGLSLVDADFEELPKGGAARAFTGGQKAVIVIVEPQDSATLVTLIEYGLL